MNNDDVYEDVKRIMKPVFDKVLKEIDLNQVQVGSRTHDQPFFVFIQPHNYRGWYDFNKDNYKPRTHLKKLKRWGMVRHKQINYGKEDFFQFEDFNIKVKKHSIELLNKVNSKRWFSIDPFRAEEQVTGFMESMENLNQEILKGFISIVGGSSDYKLLKHIDETKITNSAIIDKIDPKLTYHTKTHKKVYSLPQIEVYNMVDAIRLIDNSIFFHHNQDIAQPLRVLAKGIMNLQPEPKEPIKIPLSYTEIIHKVNTKEDVPMILPDYLELDWDDRFKVVEHLKKVM
jgi:hypothetical protein